MIPLNQNLNTLKRSGIRRYTNLAKTVQDCVMLTLGEPDFDRAINQLQELYQKGYIQEPKYRIQQKLFYSGEPIWECYCSLGDAWALHRAESTSKKLAKKEAAYQVLCRLMEQ